MRILSHQNAQLTCFEAKLHIFLQIAENAIPSDADLQRFERFDELVRNHKNLGERKVTADDFLAVLYQPAPTGRMPETLAGHLAFTEKYLAATPRNEPATFRKLFEAEVKEFQETTLGMPFSAKFGTRFQRIALLNAWSNGMIVNKDDPDTKRIFKGQKPKSRKAGDDDDDEEEDCEPPKTRSQSAAEEAAAAAAAAAKAATAPTVGGGSPPKKWTVIGTALGTRGPCHKP